MPGIFLTNPFFTEFIYPFLLLFVLIFAVLEKTKLLGGGNKQISALIALLFSLIFLSFEGARISIVNMVPLLAVALVVILIFMLLWGFVGGKVDTGLNKGLKITAGILIGLFLLWVIFWSTGTWEYVANFLTGSAWSDKLWSNILILALVGGAIAIVLATGKKIKE